MASKTSEPTPLIRTPHDRRDKKATITGTLHYHKAPKSQFVSTRRKVAVWLPPSYDKALDQRFPVLYVHDGQNIFDAATAFGGVEWQVDETADLLIRENKIQAIIVVGIYNTPDRLLEYADTSAGRNYMQFLVEELKPFIDKTYRTRPEKEHTAVMGSSMGGLVTLYLLWRYPGTFRKAASLSPSLFWRNRAVLKNIQQAGPRPGDLQLYFDHGGLGDEGKHASDYRYLRMLLHRQGYRRKLDYEYYFDKNGDHSERAWARRVWRPLTFLFGIK